MNRGISSPPPKYGNCARFFHRRRTEGRDASGLRQHRPGNSPVQAKTRPLPGTARRAGGHLPLLSRTHRARHAQAERGNPLRARRRAPLLRRRAAGRKHPERARRRLRPGAATHGPAHGGGRSAVASASIRANAQGKAIRLESPSAGQGAAKHPANQNLTRKDAHRSISVGVPFFSLPRRSEQQQHVVVSDHQRA